MTLVMKGIRILEVAQYSFVPSASAILADWGADVIKVEHPTRGDPMRGVTNTGGIHHDPDRLILVEQPNRGKRSIGIDISTPKGQQLIYDLAATSDVFLTNYLPHARQKNKVELADLRRANPNIIYARGTAYGDKGPERDRGGYDTTAFWARGGIGVAMTPPEHEVPIMQSLAAFGDAIGGMNLAGGIATALLHRERSGVATEVDVSLMSTAWWAASSSLAFAMETGLATRAKLPSSGSSPGNPFMGIFRTSDGRAIMLGVVSPGSYIRDIFEHLGLPQCADDPRFSTLEELLRNWVDASGMIVSAIGQHSFEYWSERLQTMKAQWAPFHTILDLAKDVQALANDMIIEVEAADHGQPLRLVRSPVQFDHAAVETTRAPQASEHTESVLMELGVEWAEIEYLKTHKIIT